MISLGERMISESLAITITEIFLTTPFEGGRHVDRLRKLDEPA
jgi:ribose 5-phosphate isomerase B